ncbi:MAG: MaoC family dehydratase N-terminal domain-containing protein [Anaerolineae bacterium]|nr:MaoC family dehydratase N-terminal domain-containing protein [Anaerolineae bacterium]
MSSPTGLYYEDFQLGQKLVTRGRTVTEADIVQFGALTGDFNPMHFDAEYMKTHLIGQRIAHGMLTMSYAVGQAYQLGFMDKTVLAFREVTMKFSIPVFIGDTMHVELEVREMKDAARMGGGLVTLGVKIIKQDGSAVQKGEWVVLIASHPKASA